MNRTLLSRIAAVALLVAASVALSAQARPAGASRNWHYGAFLNAGNGLIDRTDFHFLSLGLEGGKNLTPYIHAGPFSGHFEYAVNIMPFWQAYTPAQHTVYIGPTAYGYGGGTYTGFSITPTIFRWDFASSGKKFQPWFQAAGGSLYTTHKFPGTVLVTKGTPGGTSVFNFTPQGGVGFHYFARPNRSLDVGLNAVHISSASLGDKNPGVNASLQLLVGYSWWK